MLAKSESLLIAYNFDPASTGYIGYSLANKMPECLASGAPLLAYGPRGVATIDYLEAAGIAEVVTENGAGGLADAIERLVLEPARGSTLAEAAMAHVDIHLSRSLVHKHFRVAV